MHDHHGARQHALRRDRREHRHGAAGATRRRAGDVLERRRRDVGGGHQPARHAGSLTCCPALAAASQLRDGRALDRSAPGVAVDSSAGTNLEPLRCPGCPPRLAETAVLAVHVARPRRPRSPRPRRAPSRRRPAPRAVQRHHHRRRRSVAPVEGQDAVDQPGELHRRKGQRRHGHGGHRRQRRARPGPGLEDLALGARSKPKQTFTLAEITGPGAIQHIWMTPTGNWRFAILRVYWDGETTPSVECPVGDFFASRLGQATPRSHSLPVCVNPGSAFNSYWPMPFRKSAPDHDGEHRRRSEMTLYYQIDYALDRRRRRRGATSTPSSAASNPLPYKQVYTILDGVKGEGHYVGTLPGLGRAQQRLVGRRRDQVLHGRRRRVPHHRRHRHRGLLLRLLQFREPGRRTQYQEFSTPYSGLPQVIRPDGALPVAAALRPVPLAHHGSDPLREGPARDDPGARLAQRRPLPAPAGRHRVGGLLVPARAARAVPGAAGPDALEIQ